MRSESIGIEITPCCKKRALPRALDLFDIGGRNVSPGKLYLIIHTYCKGGRGVGILQFKVCVLIFMSQCKEEVTLKSDIYVHRSLTAAAVSALHIARSRACAVECNS
jgi:hypothetical protein